MGWNAEWPKRRIDKEYPYMPKMGELCEASIKYPNGWGTFTTAICVAYYKEKYCLEHGTTMVVIHESNVRFRQARSSKENQIDEFKRILKRNHLTLCGTVIDEMAISLYNSGCRIIEDKEI